MAEFGAEEYGSGEYGGGPNQFISPEHALASGMLSAALAQKGFSVTPVLDGDGNYTPVLLIAEDITPWTFRIRIEGIE